MGSLGQLLNEGCVKGFLFPISVRFSRIKRGFSVATTQGCELRAGRWRRRILSVCADFFNSPGSAHNSLEMLREIVRKILASPALFVDPFV